MSVFVSVFLVLLGFCSIWAQRYTATQSSLFTTGSNTSMAWGYKSNETQGAVLGRSVAGGVEDLLLLSDQSNFYLEKSSGGGSLLTVPVVKSDALNYTTTDNTVLSSNFLGGMAVLRPLNGTKQSALVAIATICSLQVYEIIFYGSTYNYAQLKSIALPNELVQSTGSYGTAGPAKRLALLSTSVTNGDVYYHLAIGNPTYQDGSNAGTGRVDFLTLCANGWGAIRTNKTGITSSVPGGMYALGADARFGIALASAGDVDGDGVADLATLAPASTVHPNGALYIFFMKDASNPKDTYPKKIEGKGMPWVDGYSAVPTAHSCNSLASSDVDGDGKRELLLGCNITTGSGNRMVLRSLDLSSTGDIEATQVLQEMSCGYGCVGSGDPLVLWNTDRGVPSVARALVSYETYGLNIFRAYVSSYNLYDVDLANSFAVTAGKATRDSLVELDSLFYGMGATGYTLTTLSGQANCETYGSGTGLGCRADAAAAGTWSTLEVTAQGTCPAYHPCKRKDTLYVYARPADATAPNLASRLPKAVVLRQGFASQPWGNLRSLAYLADYVANTTSIRWKGFLDKSAERVSAPFQAVDNSFTLSANGTNLGVDTLDFELVHNTDTLHAAVEVHVVAPEFLRQGQVPADPGKDTVYGLVWGSDIYIELPLASSSGTSYSYDVPQDFDGVVELVGNYLRLRQLDEVTIPLSYMEGGLVKTRSIALSSLSPTNRALDVAVPNDILLHVVPGGLALEGLGSSAKVRVYGLDGRLRFHANLAGNTAFAPCVEQGVHIVRVDTERGSQVFKVAR